MATSLPRRGTTRPANGTHAAFTEAAGDLEVSQLLPDQSARMLPVVNQERRALDHQE